MGDLARALGVFGVLFSFGACGDNLSDDDLFPTISIQDLGGVCNAFSNSLCDRIDACGVNDETFGVDCDATAFDFCCQGGCSDLYSGSPQTLETCTEKLEMHSCIDIVNYSYPEECQQLMR